MCNVAYRRISTNNKNQKTERQLFNLGVDFAREYEDHATGTKLTSRVQLQACLDSLVSGDTLYIHSIDRLARNTSDLLNITQDLLDRGIGIKFVKEGLCVGSEEDPMAKAMGQMLLSVLGAVHTFQATMIQESVKEGLRVAKSKGKLAKGKDSSWRKSFEANRSNHKSKVNSDKTRVAKQPVADAVARMLKYSSNALNLEQIASHLTSEGFTTPRGSYYSKASVSRLIKEFDIDYVCKTR